MQERSRAYRSLSGTTCWRNTETFLPAYLVAAPKGRSYWHLPHYHMGELRSTVAVLSLMVSFMMLKTIFYWLGVPLLAQAQAPTSGERFPLRHTVFAGVQLPLSYTAGYQLQVSRRFSGRVQGGLIVPPFDRYTLKTLEGFGLDRQLSQAIDRSFRRGTSLSLGVNVHANSPWYAGLFGQYVHLTAGSITPAEGLGLYFQRDFSGFGLLASPAFVFDMQSTLWLGGLRVGRTFQLTDSRFGLNLEAGLGKIFTTHNTFASNRSLVDALGVTQRLYADLDHEVDTSLRQHGYLPTLDVLLTYRLGRQ